jgi:hypothetical protein
MHDWILTAILREAWSTSYHTEDRREKIQALSLAKECYSMKLESLTNATVVDDAIRFVCDKSKDKERLKASSSDNSGDGDERQKEESEEPDYNEDRYQREEEQEEEIEEITTTNQVF